MGQLDGLTTDPTLPASLRSKGIDSVVKQVLSDAKALKLRNVTAFTSNINILTRSASHGFQPMDCHLIVVDTSS
jgi:hypothetical protein